MDDKEEDTDMCYKVYDLIDYNARMGFDDNMPRVCPICGEQGERDKYVPFEFSEPYGPRRIYEYTCHFRVSYCNKHFLLRRKYKIYFFMIFAFVALITGMILLPIAFSLSGLTNNGYFEALIFGIAGATWMASLLLNYGLCCKIFESRAKSKPDMAFYHPFSGFGIAAEPESISDPNTIEQLLRGYTQKESLKVVCFLIDSKEYAESVVAFRQNAIFGENNNEVPRTIRFINY